MTDPPRELYQVDGYLKSFRAEIVAVDADGAVALDRTAFYPGGGGQPHDLGTLEHGDRATAVTRVFHREGKIWHQAETPIAVVGDKIVAHLDWQRRHALMRTHTALHILCGVVWRDHRAKVTGGSMKPLAGRLDFELEALSRDLVEEIEAKLNAEVAAARPVVVGFLTREAALEIPDLVRTKIDLVPKHIREIRTVEIVGLDLQADGGTHVANTAEVGEITVTRYKTKGRINKRIELGLGGRLR